MPNSGLPAVWELPEEFRRRLGDQAGRQRAMFSDGHLLLVLHAPPAPEEVTRQGRFFWRKPDGAWQSSIKGNGIAALRNHVEEYLEALNRCEELENRAQSANEYFELLAMLGPIVHASKNLHLVLQEPRKLVAADRDIINLRDRAGNAERTGELLYQVTKNGLDYAVAKRGEEQARSSHQMLVAAHRLNMLVAFFFPVATLSALFGMNFKTGIEGQYTPLPLFAVLGVGIVCGFLLKLAISRRA